MVPQAKGLGAPFRLIFPEGLVVPQPCVAQGGIVYNREGQPLRLCFVLGPRPPLPDATIQELVLCKPDDAALVWLQNGSSDRQHLNVGVKAMRDLWRLLGNPATEAYPIARLLTAGAWQSVAVSLGLDRYRYDISLVVSTEPHPNT